MEKYKKWKKKNHKAPTKISNDSMNTSKFFGLNRSKPSVIVKNPILIKHTHQYEEIDSELHQKICESEIISNDSHNLKPINSSRLHY